MTVGPVPCDTREDEKRRWGSCLNDMFDMENCFHMSTRGIFKNLSSTGDLFVYRHSLKIREVQGKYVKQIHQFQMFNK